MKGNDVFPSKYLKAEDLDGDLTVTISGVRLETMKDKKGDDEQKPVASFKEVKKGLVLNKTNWAAIAKQHGDESDDWAGKQITLTVLEVDSFGDVVQAIRVKAVKIAPKKTNGAAPAPDMKADWLAFCQNNSISEADIRQALGMPKVSEWIAAEVGRTLEQAKQLCLGAK